MSSGVRWLDGTRLIVGVALTLSALTSVGLANPQPYPLPASAANLWHAHGLIPRTEVFRP